MRIIGKTLKFTYPDYGTPDGYPDYTAHSGQSVKVLRRLAMPEVADEVEMYAVEAEDGWKGHVNRDELTQLDLPEIEQLIKFHAEISAEGLKKIVNASAIANNLSATFDDIMQNIPAEVYLTVLRYLQKRA